MYLLFGIFIILIVASITSLVTKEKVYVRYEFRGIKRKCSIDTIVYFVLSIVLMTMLAFCRFRLGDYNEYEHIFEQAPLRIDFKDSYYTVVHSEPLWKLVCQIFRICGLEFEQFFAMIAVFNFALLNRFVLRYFSGYKCLALLWIYVSLYLSYLASQLRHAVILCVFLGILLPLLEEKKYIRYFIVVILSMMIHSVAFIYLIMPLAVRFKTRLFEIATIVSFALGLLITKQGYAGVIYYLLPTGLTDHCRYTNNIEWGGLFFRIVILLVVVLAYHLFSNEEKGIMSTFYKMYLIGMCMYFLFSYITVLPIRLFDTVRMLEILLLCNYLTFDRKKMKYLFLAIILSLSAFLYVKRFDEFFQSTNKYNQYNIYSYPYESIFTNE